MNILTKKSKSFFIAFTILNIFLLTHEINANSLGSAVKSRNFFRFFKSNSSHDIKIKPISSCKAELDNGALIDLTPLNKPGSPRSDISGDYSYKFNPCGPIICGDEKLATAAVCQVSHDGVHSYNCGDQSSYKFSATSGNELTMTFTNAGTQKTSTILCKCGETESFQFISERPQNSYTLTFQSPCCCEPSNAFHKKCGGGTGPDVPTVNGSGLSVGSILVIILFSIAGLYIIAGILIMKYVRGASGVEMVPNRGVWVSVFDNIKEGFSFSIQKVKTVGGGYKQIS